MNSELANNPIELTFYQVIVSLTFSETPSHIPTPLSPVPSRRAAPSLVNPLLCPASRVSWGSPSPSAPKSTAPSSGLRRRSAPDGASVRAPGWTAHSAHLDTEAALGSGHSGSDVSSDWAQEQGRLVAARRPGRARVRGRRGTGGAPPRTTSPGLGVRPPSPPPPRGDAYTTTRRGPSAGSSGLWALPGSDSVTSRAPVPTGVRLGQSGPGGARERPGQSPRRRPAGLGPWPAWKARARAPPVPAALTFRQRPRPPPPWPPPPPPPLRKRQALPPSRLTGRLGRSGRRRP